MHVVTRCRNIQIQALQDLVKSGSLTQEQAAKIRVIRSIEMAKAEGYLQYVKSLESLQPPQYLSDDDEDDEIALQRQEDNQSPD